MSQPPYVPQQPQYGPPPVPPGQPAYAPQQYAPAPQQPQYQQPAYPQQPYQAPYAPPPPPPAPVVNASVEDFLNQPHTGGGASLAFGDKPTGYSVTGRVSRKVGRADIQVQTDTITRQPQFYKDGRPKLVMLVPLDVQPSAEFPEGKATWWVKGNARDELAAGMARAGASTEVPEEGATVVITKTGSRPIQGRTPQVLYRVDYYPPAGAAPQPEAQVQAPPAPPQPEPQNVTQLPQFRPQQSYAPPGQPQWAPPPAPAGEQPYPAFTGQVPLAQEVAQAPVQRQQEAPQPPDPPAPPVQAAPQAPAAGPQPTPAQQMLLNQLANGGQPPAPQG